jgi:D-alanyl-D-alanine carboxypeptidase (penicillin-binding protein 5/6)
LNLLGAPVALAADDPFPKAASAYLVAIDGRVIWERAADTPRAPASLTKIMTALVLLDGEWNPDAPVRIGPLAAAATGSRLGLAAGDELSAGDLLTAMLVRSANDACLALAEHAGGSVAHFVATMNARAEALGLAATRFANPCGFDDPAQRSSARDLWRLTEAALAAPEFARRVALARAEVRTKAGRVFRFETSNALLGSLPGAAGVKTGYTRGAGKCVVALAEREGRRVVAVLLDAPDRWWAAAAIVEKAFEAARVGP